MAVVSHKSLYSVQHHFIYSLHRSCLDMSKPVRGSKSRKWDEPLHELSSSENEAESGQIVNSLWTNAVTSFKYSENLHLYIASTCQVIAKFVCSWIGAVQDCYSFHASFMKSSFKPFTQDFISTIIYEIGEEASALHFNHHNSPDHVQVGIIDASGFVQPSNPDQFHREDLLENFQDVPNTLRVNEAKR